MIDLFCILRNLVYFSALEVLADCVYYVAANIIGTYSKLMNEITLRGAFLDRRSCIVSTLKLEYEKNQEVRIY